MTFYVTFHGGSPSQGITSPQQFVVSYTSNGSGGWTVNDNVFNLPAPSQTYNELRDIQLCADGNFYVANAYKNASVIWQIPPTGAPSSGPAIFTQGAVPPCTSTSSPTPVVSIYHPFGFAFDAGMDTCYLSNQDDNIVVAVYGPKAASPAVPGEPLPVNPWLLSQFPPPPSFLPGTFVASQTGFLAPCVASGTAAPPDVSSALGGLAYSPSSGPPLSNSVRGAALLGTTLFVADEVGNLVRVYDTTCVAAPSTINDPSGLIESPTHLLIQGSMLYIVVAGGSKSTDPAVLSYDTSQGSGTSNTSLKAVVSGVKNPSGITFDNATPPNFYVASRTGQVISQYDSTFKLLNANYIPGPGKVSTLPDQPEFILFVA